MRLFGLFGKDEGLKEIDERKNLIILFLAALIPFYFIMLSALIMLSIEANIYMIYMVVGVGAMAWMMILFGWYVRVKDIVTSFFCFEGAEIHYDESTSNRVDLKFYPEEIRYVGTLPDSGRDTYLVPFIEKFTYDHPVYGEITYDKAFMIMPFPHIPFEHTFAFRSKRQLWHMNMIATSSACEGASFHVSPFWEETETEFIPIFVVADSHIQYVVARAQMEEFDKEGVIEIPKENEKGEIEIESIKIADLAKTPNVNALELVRVRILEVNSRLLDLKVDNANLSKDREKLLQRTETRDKQVIEEYEKSDRRLMRAKKGYRFKILNAKYLFGLGILVFAFAVLVLLAYVFG